MRKRFCDINPFCYAVSVKKEVVKRHIKNLSRDKHIAKTKSKEPLPNLVHKLSGNLVKRAPGVDLTTQYNKVVNIDIACKKINGILIKPGETFSFWSLVGSVSARNGFKTGRVIIGNKLTTGLGGGLCNLSNSIHILVLHTPAKVTELHTHSDALAPDEGARVPLSAGTSVFYNYLDFRFHNTTDQTLQLLLWCEGETFYGEIRSEREFPCTYEIVEENHRFQKEGAKYYRVSQIYKESFDRKTGQKLQKELIWNNHSRVMFDYDLIPKELVAEP